MPREFKTVLCGTDFSEPSIRALEYGLRFARNANGTLIVTHVVHVPGGDFLGEEAYLFNFREAETRVMGLLRELHVERLDRYPKCELRADVGDPAEQILRLAHDRKADLIVTATHGRSGLLQLVMGSVAEKLVRHARCPIFVVPSGVD